MTGVDAWPAVVTGFAGSCHDIVVRGGPVTLQRLHLTAVRINNLLRYQPRFTYVLRAVVEYKCSLLNDYWSGWPFADFQRNLNASGRRGDSHNERYRH